MFAHFRHRSWMAPRHLRLLGVVAAHGALAAGAGRVAWEYQVAAPAPPPIPIVLRLAPGKKALPEPILAEGVARTLSEAPPPPWERPLPTPEATPPEPGPEPPRTAPIVSTAVKATAAAVEGPARRARSPRATRPAATAHRERGVAGRGGGGGDGAPVLISSTTPPYPAAARVAKAQGSVIVRVTVDVRGRVTAAALYRSAGHEALDAAALKAVRGWRFRPATADGRTVAADALVRVRFSMG